MKVIIDNGHGADTPGKCSPDRRIREWSYTREIAQRLEAALKAKGIPAVRIVKEEKDISLKERTRRANAIYKEDRSSILISIHLNAAGNKGQWMAARGFEAIVSIINASGNSRRLARELVKQAKAVGLNGNRAIPVEGYWSQNLAICRDTHMPAVLTENLYQDNWQDVAYLLSEEGKQAIVDLHVEAIRKYYML